MLLIGDSIAIGYKAMVIKALAGKANVDVWPNPFFQSEKLNQQLARILKHGPYAVVHVNVGLHGVEEGRIKPGTFEPLTRAYIQVIRDTMPKAQIIWANTTQFTIKGKPTELDPVKKPTVLEHNRIAAKLMADMLATAADVLEVKLPDNGGEDSVSLLPVLLGKQPPTPLRKAIIVQGDTDDNAIAICSGRWKVIESANARKENSPPTLRPDHRPRRNR